MYTNLAINGSIYFVPKASDKSKARGKVSPGFYLINKEETRYQKLIVLGSDRNKTSRYEFRKSS